MPSPTGPSTNQESVWDYPRPPRIEDFARPIQIVINGTVIAATSRAHWERACSRSSDG